MSGKLRIQIYLKKDEFEAIRQKAAQVRLPMSAYARNLCLGYEPKSMANAQAIRDLVKVNADMGRIGGLLKLWLSEPDRNQADVRQLLHDLLDAKERLAEKISAL